MAIRHAEGPGHHNSGMIHGGAHRPSNNHSCHNSVFGQMTSHYGSGSMIGMGNPASRAPLPTQQYYQPTCGHSNNCNSGSGNWMNGKVSDLMAYMNKLNASMGIIANQSQCTGSSFDTAGMFDTGISYPSIDSGMSSYPSNMNYGGGYNNYGGGYNNNGGESYSMAYSNGNMSSAYSNGSSGFAMQQGANGSSSFAGATQFGNTSVGLSTRTDANGNTSYGLGFSTSW